MKKAKRHTTNLLVQTQIKAGQCSYDQIDVDDAAMTCCQFPNGPACQVYDWMKQDGCESQFDNCPS